MLEAPSRRMDMPRALPTIELSTPTAVVADLHLDTGAAGNARAFTDWLARCEGLARLVILGDLFDVWVGPAQAREPGAEAVLTALAACVARGTQVEVVPGNRDFLLGSAFEVRSGARVHREGFVGSIAGRRILFVHGDTLCTKDHGYLRLRRVLRSAPVGWLAPRVPLSLGTRIARRLRRESVRALAQKLPDEKSIQTEAVATAARAEQCETLVCGHAHEPRDERVAGGVRFVVVGAFGGARDVLEIAPDGDLRSSTSRG